MEQENLKKLSMNIVNQILELSGISAEKRQSINDKCDAFVLELIESEAASLRKELEEAKKQRKGWHDQWFKIVDAIVPKAKCRDCADENGICSTTKVPCNPTDAVIYMYNEERAKSAKLEAENEELKVSIIDEVLRSNKTVEALKKIIDQSPYCDDMDSRVAKQAIAEYEGKGGEVA